MSNVSISTNNLIIGYGSSVVQSDISCRLYQGELIALLGPNGCGKSTLLRTLAGLQPPLGGETSLSHCSRKEMAKQVAIVLTDRLSLSATSVEEVVAMGRLPYASFLGAMSSHDRTVVKDAIRSVEIEPLSRKLFDCLSDGEKQRVLIAKALAQQTPIILLDEPTAHLDLPNRIKTLQLLQRLSHQQQKTIIISTHELDLAARLSDRIMLLSTNGVLLDTPAHLQATDAFSRAFGMKVNLAGCF